MLLISTRHYSTMLSLWIRQYQLLLVMITPLPYSRPLKIHLRKNVAHQGIVTPNYHTRLNIMLAALVMILLLVIQIAIILLQEVLGKPMLIKFILKQSQTFTILEFFQIGNIVAVALIISDRG